MDNNINRISITNNNKISIPYKIIKEKPIGRIIINKINIDKPLYKINSPENNVDKNITILKESNYPHNIFIAAHSGTGNNAYFKDLDKLDINDEITIEYYNNIKKYLVESKNIQKKNGYINISNKEINYLILTTCYPYDDNYQLIVSCIEKES